jgi:ribosomal protein S18 acetylase RimI-like enzyme
VAKAKVVVERKKALAVRRYIRNGLIEHNVAAAGRLRWKRFVLSAREGSKIVGGLVGEVFWNSAFVELLWIDETARGRGHGWRLMKEAEKIARRERRDLIYLNTFSFQAPGFYRKLGYMRFGVLKNSPSGASRIFLVKYLPN